jgi:hypothetical protein
VFRGILHHFRVPPYSSIRTTNQTFEPLTMFPLRNFLLAICGKRRPFRRQLCVLMIGVPAMLHHQTAVLHDLDASVREDLSNLVIPYS